MEDDGVVVVLKHGNIIDDSKQNEDGLSTSISPMVKFLFPSFSEAPKDTP